MTRKNIERFFMDVSIIIVNYKTVPLILNCLRSVYQYTENLSFEIIVVDNNSGDDFERKIKAEYDNVKCIALAENIGFGRANNEGIKVAQGRNILFLNPDTLLLNNAVKILSDYLDAHPTVGVCGGNLYDEEMKPTHSYFMLLPSFVWELDLLCHGWLHRMAWGKNVQFNHRGKPRKVGYICGADMMVKRSVLEQVGCFSPLFFMYYEETELTYRIKDAGYSIISVPEAKIQHLEGKSMGGKQINMSRILYSERSLSIYYSLHANGFQRRIYRVMRLLRLYIRHNVVHPSYHTSYPQLYKECKSLILDDKNL